MPAGGAILHHAAARGRCADYDSYYWYDTPPHDLAAQQGGRAHLTWIFAAPFFAGGGTGTALLAAARAVLCHRGYTQLSATFLLGKSLQHALALAQRL